jgi:transposase InsO family protein
VSRIRTIAGARPNGSAPRGFSRQRDCRIAEALARQSAVATVRWLVDRDVPEAVVSRRIGLAPRTTRDWRQRWREDRLLPRARGRPVERPDRDLRNAILSLFELLGPDVPVERLREEFPDVSRAELRELKRRYRRVWRRGEVRFVPALRWLVPGSVWAMDFSHPPLPVDGIFPRLLPTRDLPSGNMLEVLPAPGEDARTACDLLRALIRRHGAPLVVKTDNGPAFRSDAFNALLQEHGILALRSPPYTPAYNGAIETGNGTLKTHAHYASARHDRPGEWTCDDVEEARRRGNAYSRPYGRGAGSPDEVWGDRIRIGEARRRHFLAVYEEEVEREKKRRGVLPLVGPTPQEEDSINRFAISKALRRCGYLLIRRRRIAPPIHCRKAADIRRG